MANLQFPVVVCAEVPSYSLTTVPLPFGLPEFFLVDPCSMDIDLSLDQLRKLLAPLIPFLQLIQCAALAIELLTGIPKILGPPPSISGVIKVTQQATQLLPCVQLIIGYTPAGMFLTLVCMIKGLLTYMINLLNCLIAIVTTNLGIFADSLAAAANPDPELRAMGVCLTSQGNQLQQALLAKLVSVNTVISLLNAVVSAVPLLSSTLTGKGFPLSPIDTSKPLVDPTPLEDLKAVLQTVVSILSVVPGAACP